MNSIVVHYKELALKGRTARGSSSCSCATCDGAGRARTSRSVRSVMGRIEIELGADAPWDEVRERLARGVRHRELLATPAAAPHDFDALAAAILADLGDRQPASFRVSARARRQAACRSPRRRSSARSAACIKEAKGWRVDLDRPGADRSTSRCCRTTRSTSSARSRAPAACRPAPAAASRACCRAASIRRSPRTG